MDQVCMYQYFSQYTIQWDAANRVVKQLKKRKNAAVVIASPYCKNSMDNEYWCYQMLMLFTPFRNHAEVMVYPTYRDLSSIVISDPHDEQDDNPHEVHQHPVVYADVPVATASEPGAKRPRCFQQDEEEEQVSLNEEYHQTADLQVTQSVVPQRAYRVGEEEEENLSVEQCSLADPRWNATCDLPETQPITARVVGDRCYALPSATCCDLPQDPTCDLPHDPVCDIPHDPTSEVPHDPTCDLPDDQTPAAAHLPFRSASTLLKLVITNGAIDPAFAQTTGVLDLLEGYMKDAFADSVTMPTEAEVIMRLREIGYDEENTCCIDELMTKMALDFNLRQEHKVTGVDQPDRRFFLGKHYDTFIADFNDAAKTDGKAANRTQPVLNTTESSSDVDKLRLLERHRSEIIQATGTYQSLKLRQKAVLLMLLNTLQDMIERKSDVNQSLNIRTCRLVLQGEAGTGKTFVLKQAVKLMCLFLDPQCIRVFAPTAHAAKTYQDLPCGSSTFHKVWSKGWGPESSNTGHVDTDLVGTRLQTWAASMHGVQALICDEMSMMSPLDVDLMSRRLTAVLRKDNAYPGGPFNDLPIVILCGDLYQLPPVKAWSLYHGEIDTTAAEKEGVFLKLLDYQKNAVRDKWSHHNRGLELYRTFFDQCMILNENVRQEGDQEWRYLLKRVRCGAATEADTRFLNDHVRDERELLQSHSENAHIWQTCKRFYPTVNMVLEEGRKMFQSAYPNLSDQFDASPIITVNKNKAEHDEVRKFGSDMYKAAFPLKLAVGAPVMVTSNVSVARGWGIVNGSTGTVVGYITRDGVNPTYVLVQIDAVLAGMPRLTIKPPGSSTPIVFRNTWPFVMCTSSSKKRRPGAGREAPADTIVIKYFPLTLSYALTIHKAQGMTEDYAVVDVKQDGGSPVGSGQLPYVALSRVRTADGLWLRRAVDRDKDVNRFARTSDCEKLKVEFIRMEALQQKVLDALGFAEEDEALAKRICEEELSYGVR